MPKYKYNNQFKGHLKGPGDIEKWKAENVDGRCEVLTIGV